MSEVYFVSKVTKILTGFISTVVLLLIILLLSVLLAFTIPSVQTRVAQAAMGWASEWLGVEVSLSRIAITFPLNVEIDDFYVEDYGQDTMIYVKKAKAPIKYITPKPFELGFGRVQLEDGEFILRADSTDQINIKLVVNRLKENRDPNKPRKEANILFDGIEGKHLRYLQLLNLKEYDSPIDYGNMELKLDTICLKDFGVYGDSVRMNLRYANFTERSGFRIDTLQSRVITVCRGLVLLDDAVIDNEDSHLNLSKVHLIGDSWDSFHYYIDSVRTEVTARNTTVSTRSLAYFANIFDGMSLQATNVNASTWDVLSSYKGRVSSADIEGASVIASFTSKGLPEMESTIWNLDITDVSANATAINRVIEGVTSRPLPSSLTKMLSTQGNMHINGRFNGSFNNFATNLHLRTLSGMAEASAKMRRQRSGNYMVDYSVATSDFSLARLLSNTAIGDVTFDANMVGELGKNGFDTEYSLEIDSIRLLEHTYSKLLTDGTIKEKCIKAKMESFDPAMLFSLDATADFNKEKPHYLADLNVWHSDLAALALNKRDSISVISLEATLDAEATGLDDLAGSFDIRNCTYRYDTDTIRGKHIALRGHNNDKSKYLKLTSAFADAEFRSRLSYNDILGYLDRFIDSYLPVLESQKIAKVEERIETQGEAGDYSLLSLKVKDVKNITHAVAEGLQIADGTSLNFMFNPVNEEFSLRAKSDYLEYNDIFAAGLNVNAGNKGDSLSLYVTSEDLYVKRLYIPNLRVQGGARNHNISLSTRFANKEEDYSAMLGLRTMMTRTRNGRAVNIYVIPSHITSKDKTWYISSQGITYDTAQIQVRDFIISSPSHGGLGAADTDSLRVYGVASRSEKDTLRVRMSNVDLSPLLQIAQNVGYDISAIANGSVDMVSALKGGRLNAEVDIDSMVVSGFEVAPSRIRSNWDFQRKRVAVRLDNRRIGDNVVTGFYDPTGKRFLADVHADSIPLGLLDPLLGDVLRETTGKANARLRVTGDMSGEKPQVKINGLATAQRFETTIDYLNVRYGMDKVMVDFEDNIIKLRPNFATDTRGQRCNMGLMVDLNKLKNIKYRIDLRPENLMVLNTTAKENDMFYGKLYASGSAVIKGDNMGAVMTARARPNENSKFCFSLNSTSQASDASFVRFVDFDAPRIDSSNYLQSKLLAYELRRKRLSSSGASFKLGLDIDLTPDAEVELIIDPTMGGDMQGRGEGNLAINMDTGTGAFTMHGTVALTEGTYNFAMHNILADKKFSIVPGGTITWTGDPMDAILDLDATYRLKASIAPLAMGNESLRGNVPVECNIRLTDDLWNPTITFGVTVPNADLEIQNLVANAMSTQELTATQFFYLLAFGSFYSESSGLAESLNVGSFGSATGFEFLSNQLSSWLSSEQYDIILRYIPSNELTGDEFDFGFSKGLINDRLLLEIEGNYVSDRATTGAANNASNLSGDFFLTWLLNRSGSLKLKGFSQTITRFDENQGLQENGIGLYFQKDFNSLGELFSRKRKRNSKFATDSEIEDAYYDNPDYMDIDAQDLEPESNIRD